MITVSQRKDLKKLIGYRHIAKISQYLKEQGVKNRYDEDYSTVYIGEVFNGKTGNEKIEQHIWKLADVKIAEAEKAEEEQEKIKERFEKFTSPKKNQKKACNEEE